MHPTTATSSVLTPAASSTDDNTPANSTRATETVKRHELDSRLPEPDTVSLVSRVDDSTVTVGSQQLGDHGAGVVLLRVQSPLLETTAASYLAPDEAHLLAAALSTAALTATDRRHVVSFGEGTSAEEIGQLLDTLPPGSTLTDFSCDATACLVFTCPSQ